MRRYFKFNSLPSSGGTFRQVGRPTETLRRLDEFGHNPGALVAKYFLPDNVAPKAPLVVVLHGCTQTADQYDHGSGWSTAARDYGFALLYPEQQRSNNPNLCFNWFLPQDARRDRGEALSIRKMIAAMIETHKLDPARVYITGLSAGGAMANVLLATYPELFAGGAIIAGLPYGTATDVPKALERMRGQGLPDDRKLGDLVRGATDYEGPWPTVSIWHGSADATVYPSNADATLAQWRSVHGLAREPNREDIVDNQLREIWCDGQGHDVIVKMTIAGMGHGTPLAVTGADACGAAGPYMLDRQISSTRHICRHWGLTDGALEIAQGRPLGSSEKVDRNTPASRGAVERPMAPATPDPAKGASSSAAAGIGRVIDDALRAAGLMR